MARKVDEAANFVFAQLIEQHDIYDKCHADYARRDKIDLAWGKNFSRDEGVWNLVKFFRIST
jgi:hypothetical protein